MGSYDWIFVGMGVLGAVLTSASWIPQIIKAVQSRQLRDLSWAMLGIFDLGSFCWLIYGIHRTDWIIIGANAFILTNVTSLILMKAFFRPRR